MQQHTKWERWLRWLSIAATVLAAAAAVLLASHERADGGDRAVSLVLQLQVEATGTCKLRPWPYSRAAAEMARR